MTMSKNVQILSQVALIFLFFLTCILSSNVSDVVVPLSLPKVLDKESVESVNAGIDFCMPVEIIDVCENNKNYIEITTFEKSFVKAPFSLVVYQINKDNMRGIVIEKYGYTCYVMGFDVINIADGSMVFAGEIVGSIASNKLYVKVYKNENRISLKTIRKIFNV